MVNISIVRAGNQLMTRRLPLRIEETWKFPDLFPSSLSRWWFEKNVHGLSQVSSYIKHHKATFLILIAAYPSHMLHVFFHQQANPRWPSQGGKDIRFMDHGGAYGIPSGNLT